MNNSKAERREEEIVTVEESDRDGRGGRGRVGGRGRRNGGRSGCGPAKKPENSKSQDETNFALITII